MNEHPEGVEISAFLDGALSPEDRARVDAHVSHCAGCRSELESLRHLKLALSSAPRRTLPADLALRLERRAVRAPSFFGSLTRPAVWGAGALAAAVLAFGLWRRAAPPVDELPLAPLLAAHARSNAEGPVGGDHLVASAYTDQIAASYASSDGDFQ
jgi:anti-sigma factor RsiW